MPQKIIPLPIDGVLNQITAAISQGQDVIIRASPGSGKTTRVPPALLECVQGEIWVLEPRRLAARMSATRVAQELNENPGQTVGWQMRFDRQYSNATRILFLTEGMFLSRVAQDPELLGVGCIILDEFHERHQQTDVAFALSKHLQITKRSELRLIVMSATLDIDSLKTIMPDAKIINLDLPLFPVSIKYQSEDQTDHLADRVSTAVGKLIKDASHSGHILVFLPGTADILRAHRKLHHFIDHDQWKIFELRGSLDKKSQDLVFEPSNFRKIILATNIAESSITIPGITAVVDSGIARIPSFNPFNNLDMLETRSISKASITQRTGRAGRTGPGITIRMFSRQDESSRPDIDTPEILRLDISQILMALIWLAEKRGKDFRPDDLPWPSPPEPRQWSDARRLLQLLGIIDSEMNLIRPNVAMLPLHPRLARFLDSCNEEGMCNEAPWLTGILANPNESPTVSGDQSHLGCDLLAQYEIIRSKSEIPSTIEKTARQLALFLNQKQLTPLDKCRPPHELDLSKPLLTSFPDRVIQRKRTTANSKWVEATMCTGGDLLLTNESAAAHGEWLIAIDANSARVSGSVINGSQPSSQRIMVSKASIIDPSDLRYAKGDYLSVSNVEEWDDTLGKSKVVRLTRYGILTISKQIISTQASHEKEKLEISSALLAKNLLENWPKPFEDSKFFDSYIVRQNLAFTRNLISHCWERQELQELLIAFICDSSQSIQDVSKHTLEEWLRFCVGEDEFKSMSLLAPAFTTIGRGHKVQINYSDSAPPWIAARLQNFFGQSKTPCILNGTLPLTVHLLAPNMLALQITTDLESFWKNTYPNLRNEYQRRYPRHFWPADPMSAEPPLPRSPRQKR